ncbi:hypothetical protein PVAG01_04366 [Phlyctema vagabunda]|uniref:Phosphatidylglycerol lysyltransferase C-terminal domain-containing protein n=1 Tax=Phlyctema vagabunda TaxID=108571 RepID=A0ABR4PP33_9HELO
MATTALSHPQMKTSRTSYFDSSGLGFSDPLVLRARDRRQKKTKKRTKSQMKKNGAEDQELLFSEKLGREIAKDVLKEEETKNMTFLDRVYYATTTTTTRTRQENERLARKTLFTGEELDIITYGSVSASEISLLPLLPQPITGTTKEGKGGDSCTTAFSLGDFNILSTIQELFTRYSNITHTAFLHPLEGSSYKFFLGKDRNAAIYYKLQKHTAIVLGDPLCRPDLFESIVSEFSLSGKQKKKQGPTWKQVAFLGASEMFLGKMQDQEPSRMMAVGVARETVLNPITNPVLLGQQRKSIAKRCRFLLDPKRGGLKIGVYVPIKARDEDVERQLRDLYTEHQKQQARDQSSSKPPFWRGEGDPFALPHLTSYIYILDTYMTSIIGFAALLPLGSKNGYHLSHPIIPIPSFASNPKGLSDLLIYSTLSLLKTCNISHLSLGYDMLPSLGTMYNMPARLQAFTRHALGYDEDESSNGYRVYLEKFGLEQQLEAELYVMLPKNFGAVRDVIHFGGARMRSVAWRWVVRTKVKMGKRNEAGEDIVEEEEDEEEDENTLMWEKRVVPIVLNANKRSPFA